MKYLILTGLFFTLTNLVFSETLTMIYKQYNDYCAIKLLSDDPIKKKFNSSAGFFGKWDKKIKPNANEQNLEEYKLAEECWGKFLGTYYSLESVLEKLVELGYKPRSAYVYRTEEVGASHNVHTFIFEKN